MSRKALQNQILSVLAASSTPLKMEEIITQTCKALDQEEREKLLAPFIKNAVRSLKNKDQIALTLRKWHIK